MSQQNDWGWGEASQDHQEQSARSSAETSDNENHFDDGWRRGSAADAWLMSSEETVSQPSAFDDPQIVEAEQIKQDSDKSSEQPAAKKAPDQGGSRPNVAILVAAGVLGMAVLGGAGWFAWDMLSPKSASAPVPIPVQVAQEQPQPTESAQAQDDKADADWLDDKKVDGQDAQQGQPRLTLAAGLDSIGGTSQAPQPPQAAAAPSVHGGPHTDSQIAGLLGGAGPSANPASQNVAAGADQPKEGSVLPKGKAARQSARSETAASAKTAAANTPQEVKVAPHGSRVADRSQHQTARVVRKPAAAAAASAPVREFVEMPQARVMAVYPMSGRWVQAWLKEEDSGRTVTLREGDIYRGVKVKEVVAESMRVVFEDGRMIDMNGAGLAPASGDGSKKDRKTSSSRRSMNKG